MFSFRRWRLRRQRRAALRNLERLWAKMTPFDEAEFEAALAAAKGGYCCDTHTAFDGETIILEPRELV